MHKETKSSSLPIGVHGTQKFSLDINSTQKTNFKLNFALTVFANLPKLPIDIASALVSEIGGFLSKRNLPVLKSTSEQLSVDEELNRDINPLRIEQEDNYSGYVQQIAECLSEGISILEDFPENLLNAQLEALNELKEGVKKLQKAEIKEINKIGSAEILTLFEEANIHFQNAVRLSFTYSASGSFSGGFGGSSGFREGAGGGFSGGNEGGAGGGSSGGGSKGGGSSGGGNGGDFSFGDDDSFGRFRAILQWIREQADRAQVSFLETIKVARTITLKAMLRAASIVFRSVREHMWSQKANDVNFGEDEINVEPDSKSSVEKLLTLEERINEAEENFNRNNKNISQEIKIYIDTIQSFNMSNNSESEKSNFDLRQSKFGGGFAAAGGIQIGGSFLDASSQQNLSEAAEQIQQLLNQLSETYPATTASEQMLVVTKALEKIEENPDFKQRVVGALKSGGTEAFKSLIDHPAIHILIAAMEGWQKPE
jgi:predicted nuclease with RNAse H fold